MARTIVVGAPCSGKSTYVREQVAFGDVVYDYDAVHQALSGQSSHRHSDKVKPYVLAARDAVWDRLEADAGQSAWIITSTKRMDRLQEMADRFGADVVFLSVSRDEAHRRCNEDCRPDEWHTYIDN